MINNTTVFKASSHVSSKKLDGIVYILDPNKGHLHTLNESAQLVWNYLIQKKSVDSIIQNIVQIYAISHREAKKDVEQLVLKWLRLEIIKMTHPKKNLVKNFLPRKIQNGKNNDK